MTSLILSRRDLEFLLYEWLDAEALCRHPRHADHSRETFDTVLDLCEEIATTHFATHNRKSDLNEPAFDGENVRIIPEVGAALKVFADAGLIAAGQDYALGGMQLPMLIEKAGFAWFLAANVGTAAYPFLTIGNANLLLAHASAEQIETWVRPMMEGRYFGTMCLSEPQAGSSLADVRTRAESRPDGSYRLFGNKMWISGGDHDLSENIVHLVLARSPDGPPGVKGISLFLVPKWLPDSGERNDVVLAGLNHKMGYRGTTNTLLNFGEGRHCPGGEAGAIGYLVGELNQGLAGMFHMMNEARIGVGLGAAALGYTGYLHALEYARQRPQGRPLAGRDPRSPQVPIIEHPDVRRMLLAQKAWVEGGLALNLYCARLVDEQRAAEGQQRQALTLLLDILTPIAKSWPSQWCLEANNLAIQVHGGYGYTRDYNVEQFYRDNRLNPIHEGTHGIQALDLLGRKVVMQDGAAFTLLLARLRETLRRASGVKGLPVRPEQLAALVERLRTVTEQLNACDDPARRLANASVYLEAFGHIIVGWIWLEQCLAAAGKSGAFYEGKRQAARFYFRHELPRVEPQLDLLANLDDTTLNMSADWF